MANEQQWTKERQANAKDSLDKLGWPLTEIETRAMLAEIERAWGEIEQQAADLSDLNATMGKAFDALAMRNDDGSVKREPIVDAAVRVAKERDSANGLYQLARLIVSAYDCEDPEQDLWDIGPMIARLRTAIDPALTAAALAETQRRDGLDEQVRALTADRDEWKRIAEEQAAMLLTRGPAIGQEIDLSDGRKATITEAWSNGAGWYVDVRHLDGSKGRMAQEGGVWRASNGPALDSDCDPTPPPEMATTTGEETPADQCGACGGLGCEQPDGGWPRPCFDCKGRGKVSQ